MKYRLVIVTVLWLFSACRQEPSPPVVPAASEEEPTTSNPSVVEPPVASPVRVPPAEAVPPEVRDDAAPAARVRQDILDHLAAIGRDDASGQASTTAAVEYLDLQQLDRQQTLFPLLEHADVSIRLGTAFYLLGQFRANDVEAVAAFTRLLTDADSRVRGIALQAMSQFERADIVDTFAELSRILSNPDEPSATRSAVVRIASRLGRDAAPLLPALTSAAKSADDERLRVACVVAASRVGAAADVIPLLSEVLTQDASPQVRRAAAQRLAHQGSAAVDAADSLGQAMEDDDVAVVQAAGETLAEFGGAAVPILMARLESTKAPTRRMAVFVLGQLGSPARPALPRLRELADDPDPQVRQLAALAVQDIQAAQ